jgi:hypothetical protein
VASGRALGPQMGPGYPGLTTALVLKAPCMVISSLLLSPMTTRPWRVAGVAAAADRGDRALGGEPSGVRLSLAGHAACDTSPNSHASLTPARLGRADVGATSGKTWTRLSRERII